MNLRVEAGGAILAFIITALLVVWPNPYFMALFSFFAQPLYVIVIVLYLHAVFQELRAKGIVSNLGHSVFGARACEAFPSPSTGEDEGGGEGRWSTYAALLHPHPHLPPWRGKESKAQGGEGKEIS